MKTAKQEELNKGEPRQLWQEPAAVSISIPFQLSGEAARLNSQSSISTNTFIYMYFPQAKPFSSL